MPEPQIHAASQRAIEFSLPDASKIVAQEQAYSRRPDRGFEDEVTAVKTEILTWMTSAIEGRAARVKYLREQLHAAKRQDAFMNSCVQAARDGLEPPKSEEPFGTIMFRASQIKTILWHVIRIESESEGGSKEIAQGALNLLFSK